jgi:Heparinase II/III N-terminus/Heparinase II/III-like protein
MMSVFDKLKRAVRGEVKPKTAALEVLRRGRVSFSSWRDLSSLNQFGTRSARFHGPFGQMDAKQLLAHFRSRAQPRFFPGFTETTATIQQEIFPEETAELIRAANRIADQHCWSLLGYGEKCFGEQIEWCRDPLSGYVSPLVYHRNVRLIRNRGSDARVLWELNRLGHLITLGRAYTVTKDEKFSTEFFKQIENWSSQNPYGQGPNWHCAMEVALRALNLLAAFELFRHSPQLTADSLSRLLALFDQHGTYIRRNLEFSYIATSNHYFSDVVGLLWLGIMLPELRDASAWRQFGLREMLRETDKQILDDGADFESSTGYHRFILELLLYSFQLCRINRVEIPNRYWNKLRAMLGYVRCYLRPDGYAPIIGDSDGGQVLPIWNRTSDDHAYLLSLGAVAFNDPSLKTKDATPTEELLWLFGESGLSSFDSLPACTEVPASRSFSDAGTHILRENDLYLCFNTSGAGINGRGSHGHNDALSIEVSVCGRAFIVDPGTYVYTADLQARNEFRSTAYHSTVEIDGREQNTTNVDSPFIIGDEAKTCLLLWETSQDFDRVSAEHYGYGRLKSPVTHRRSIVFDKQRRCWLVEDEFLGDGEHSLSIRFHFDAGLEVTKREDCVAAHNVASDVKLLICGVGLESEPQLEPQLTSRNYGERRESISACWKLEGKPSMLSWLIVPVCSGESENDRMRVCTVTPGTARVSRA